MMCSLQLLLVTFLASVAVGLSKQEQQQQQPQDVKQERRRHNRRRRHLRPPHSGCPCWRSYDLYNRFEYIEDQIEDGILTQLTTGSADSRCLDLGPQIMFYRQEYRLNRNNIIPGFQVGDKARYLAFVDDASHENFYCEVRDELGPPWFSFRVNFLSSEEAQACRQALLGFC